MPKAPQQLDLVMPLHQVATLQEELARAEEAATVYAIAAGELEAEVQDLRRECHQLQQSIRELQKINALLEIQVMLRPQPRQAPPDLQGILRDLLKLVHPDKWSQGQLATELAHTLSVWLNALREEVRR